MTSARLDSSFSQNSALHSRCNFLETKNALRTCDRECIFFAPRKNGGVAPARTKPSRFLVCAVCEFSDIAPCAFSDCRTFRFQPEIVFFTVARCKIWRAGRRNVYCSCVRASFNSGASDVVIGSCLRRIICSRVAEHCRRCAFSTSFSAVVECDVHGATACVVRH